MVTRNFYETDDVVATMLWAIQNNHQQLAFQALRELVESEESYLAQQALSLIWWLTDPADRMEQNRCDAFKEKDPFKFLCALLASNTSFDLPDRQTDTMIAPPVVTETIQSSSPWAKYPTNWTPSQAARLWNAVVYALKKNFYSHATTLVRPLLERNRLSVIALLKALQVPQAIMDTLTLTVYLPLAERILEHAFACICSTESTPIKTEHMFRSFFEAAKGRCFAIPPEALACWNHQTKSVNRLMGNPIVVAEPMASNFWKNQIKTHRCTVKDSQLHFPNDDLCESFYNTDIFSQDIPDEWSIKERAKSHGLVVPPATANPWRVAFLQCWS